MTPERRSQLRLAFDELKRAITHCLGEEHKSKDVITQMEGIIASIEQKKKNVTLITVGDAPQNFAPPAPTSTTGISAS